MKTVGDIRRANLERLVHEAGTLDAVAASIGSSSVYLSQVRNRAKDADTGKPREMGGRIARRLEEAFSKSKGWMDVDHSLAAGREASEAETLMPPTLDSSLRLLADACERVSSSTRSNVLELLGLVVTNPEANAVDQIPIIVRKLLGEEPLKSGTHNA